MKKFICPILLLLSVCGYSQNKNQEVQSTVKKPHHITLPDNQVYGNDGLDIQPQFKGGEVGFKTFLQNNFKTEKLTGSPAGKKLELSLNFIVEKDGMVTGVQITNDSGFDLAKEIKRLLYLKRDNWLPGRKDDKLVRSRYFTTIIVTIPNQAGGLPEINLGKGTAQPVPAAKKS